MTKGKAIIAIKILAKIDLENFLIEANIILI